jgi:glycerate kinase
MSGQGGRKRRHHLSFVAYATLAFVHVIMAPDSFKGSASAVEVARALAEGWSSVRPDDDLELIPMADGGEGTLDAFELAVPGARRMPVTVTGPAGDRLDTYWLLLPDNSGVIELANTSGITLLDPLRPMNAHSLGFGQAIASALDHGAHSLRLAIGGSASTDGGSGILTALGARFLDAAGKPVAPGGGGLADLDRIDFSGLRALPPGGVVVLCDVTNPLLGDHGAAAVFGPQKGASPEQVLALDGYLGRLAGRVGIDPAAPGAGAAGGAGYGLLAWGAVISAGSAAVGDALGLPARIVAADAALTGEGRFDSQSGAGKVAGYVRGLAAAAGAPVFLAAGSVAAPTTDFSASVSLVELAGSLDAARGDARRWLVEAGAQLASLVPTASHIRT